MRPFRYIFLFFIYLEIFICCNRDRNELRSFMETKIVLPGEMLKIESGSVIPVNTGDKNSRPLLVIFYGKEECVSCAVGRLPGYVEGLRKIEDGRRCDVVVIFSPEENEVKEVLDDLKERKIEFPIYLDTNGDFYALNMDFPENSKFHSFLLNRDRYPIYVGNPVESTELLDLFTKVLDRE